MHEVRLVQTATLVSLTPCNGCAPQPRVMLAGGLEFFQLQDLPFMSEVFTPKELAGSQHRI